MTEKERKAIMEQRRREYEQHVYVVHFTGEFDRYYLLHKGEFQEFLYNQISPQEYNLALDYFKQEEKILFESESFDAVQAYIADHGLLYEADVSDYDSNGKYYKAKYVEKQVVPLEVKTTKPCWLGIIPDGPDLKFYLLEDFATYHSFCRWDESWWGGKRTEGILTKAVYVRAILNYCIEHNLEIAHEYVNVM